MTLSLLHTSTLIGLGAGLLVALHACHSSDSDEGAAHGGSTASGGARMGAAGSGTTSSGATTGDDSVLERNNHASRDGNFLQPKLTKSVIPSLSKDAAFSAAFTGDMWASPLFLANGPGGKGVFFAVTTDNDVIALDETSGAVVWTKNIGDSPMMNGVNCGNIHPLGILSTPVIDLASRTIFVAGAIGTDAISSHEVHALSVDDGSERTGWPVDVTQLSDGGTKFTPAPQNQRSALSLVGGKVYVAYGGHVGDCGPYHGWVVAIDITNPANRGAWATLGQGEGIWAAGGMASDGTSVFAVTGNSTVGAGDRASSDSEQVVRLTGFATLTRSDQNLYYPTTWQTMDSQDADFGANNPIYLSVPGSTPPSYVVAISKDGHLYLLNSSNLGGMGGHVVNFSVATGAMAIHTAPAAYTSSTGVHVVFSTDGGAACPAGGTSGKVVMSVLLAPGSPPTPTVAWCTALNGPVTGPIATTSNGSADAAVWFVNNGKLAAVDGDTGASLYTSTDSCSGVRQWTSPIAVRGRIVVGGDNHLCSWSAK